MRTKGEGQEEGRGGVYGTAVNQAYGSVNDGVEQTTNAGAMKRRMLRD